MNIQDFVNVARNINNTTMKVFTLVGNEERQFANTYLVKPVLSHLSFSKIELRVSSQVRAEISYQQAAKFFQYLSAGGYTKSTYRQVKKYTHWRTAYDVQKVSFNKKYKNGNVATESKSATACRNCFLVLPLKILTIDHQRPQSGGENMAILRFFRGLGLTQGGPRIGGKNEAALINYAADVGGDNSLDDPGDGDPSKYRLSNVGKIYYTVLKHGGYIATLQEACMHHYLNLRPLCGPCNSSLKNYNIW